MIKVFSKEWFKKYNKPITWLARLPILGELIFNFNKFGHYVDRKKIVEVTPNSVVEFVKLKGKKKVVLKQHFFVRNEYALRLQKVFYPIWITFHIWDIITRPIPQLNLGFDTLEVYPVAGANSPVDGSVARSVAGESFSSIRTGDGITASATLTNPPVFELDEFGGENLYSYLGRAIYCFDTSTLTSSATISNLVLSLYITAKVNTFTSTCDFHICGATPSSTSNLSTSDYGQLGSTSFGLITDANLGTGAYEDWTLNSSGISNVSKTGISKFGTRSGYDIDNTAPTGGANKYLYVSAYMADNGSNKPKLVVTYTTAVTAGGTPSTLLTLGVG